MLHPWGYTSDLPANEPTLVSTFLNLSAIVYIFSIEKIIIKILTINYNKYNIQKMIKIKIKIE